VEVLGRLSSHIEEEALIRLCVMQPRGPKKPIDPQAE